MYICDALCGLFFRILKARTRAIGFTEIGSILETFSCLMCWSKNNMKFSSHQISFKLDWSKFGLNLAKDKLLKFHFFYQKQYYLVIYCAEFH